jgi:hypothetical protein
VEIARVTQSDWIFLLRCRRTIHSHAPRGEPRRGGERPWFYRYPTTVPSFGFLTSMISTELKKEFVGKIDLAVISCAHVPERSCEEESPSAYVPGKHVDRYGTLQRIH